MELNLICYWSIVLHLIDYHRPNLKMTLTGFTMSESFGLESFQQLITILNDIEYVLVIRQYFHLPTSICNNQEYLACQNFVKSGSSWCGVDGSNSNGDQERNRKLPPQMVPDPNYRRHLNSRLRT